MNLLTVDGRLGRLHYFLYKIGLIISAFAGFFFIGLSMNNTVLPFMSISVVILGVGIIVITFVGNVTVTVRRFHDFNQSGLVALTVIGLIYIISVLIPPAGLVMELAFLSIMFLVKGTHGDNKYGADPTIKIPVIKVEE